MVQGRILDLEKEAAADATCVVSQTMVGKGVGRGEASLDPSGQQGTPEGGDSGHGEEKGIHLLAAATAAPVPS